MHAILRYFVAALAVAALAGCSTMGSRSTTENSSQAQAELASQAASLLQRQQTRSPDKRIPHELIANARCIGVFPSIIKAGFIVGGEHGNGLVSCRQSSGGWSQAAPAVYSISGGSIGLQAGAKKSSVILLFQTRDSVDTLMQNSFDLGAGAGVTAGPVGLNTHLSGAPAPILAYVTSAKGLFAGVNLNGNRMSFDQSANVQLYGTNASPHSLLLSSHSVPSSMQTFSYALQSFAPNS